MSKHRGFKADEVQTSAMRALSFGLIGSLVFAAITALVPNQASSADNTGLITSSTKTVSAADQDPNLATAPFPNLKVTVSQTANLVSQGITISYSGMTKSTRPTGDIGGENFLQIAQCWGEDPNNPGHPDRTTCQYGLVGKNGGTRDNNVLSSTIDPHDKAFTYRASESDAQAYVAVPFNAVTGERVASVISNTDGTTSRDPNVDVNQNQFFSPLTTNFIPWAGADSSGNGVSKFEIQTVMQSPGLGCGTPQVQGTTATGQSCWLVFLPRGTHDNGQNYITTSGLLWDSWKHNVAIKLDFRPVGVRCAIGAAEHQLSGSELVAAAVASWQPKLCGGANGSAYVLSTGNEADSLTAELSNPSAPLALTSEPLAEPTAGQILYAPIAISGVVVSVAVDRFVRPFGKVPQQYKDANYSPFSNVNLTPRLLAKLLTNSYLSSVPPADKSHLGYFSALNPGSNAADLVHDPDFLAVNDIEWKYQSIISVGLSDAVTPLGRSDLSDRIWTYIMADPDARAFMGGIADPWGMKVNPWYCSDPLLNPTGTGLTLPRRDFPKADPIETVDTSKTDLANGVGPIDLVTWRPYVSDFETGAYKTLRGDANIIGPWNRNAVPPAFSKSGGQIQGNQRVVALTTAAAANKYQNITASLLNPAGNFVAPTKDAMFAGQAAMVATESNSSVRTFDFESQTAKAAANAYPLTMPVYAAVNPSLLDASLRPTYANFISFAASQGQTPGTELGQLPPGYAPLSESNIAQAMQVASLVSQGLTSVPSSIPSVVPTPSPGVPTPTPSSSGNPSPEGSAAPVVLGIPTPNDPSSGPLASAVPWGFALGAALSFVYGRIGRRRRVKRLK